MIKLVVLISATVGALAISGCVDYRGYDETTADTVCDAEGNRYPSEEVAESSGLSRAEYGATYCQ